MQINTCTLLFAAAADWPTELGDRTWHNQNPTPQNNVFGPGAGTLSRTLVSGYYSDKEGSCLCKFFVNVYRKYYRSINLYSPLLELYESKEFLPKSSFFNNNFPLKGTNDV